MQRQSATILGLAAVSSALLVSLWVRRQNGNQAPPSL
jgi:hypothetical protein